MTDLLTLTSRRKIFEHIEANSGSHLREIGRRCSVPLGTALYHLDRLEHEGLITVRRDGRYKRYFPANGLGRREKDLLSAFHHAVPRRIAHVLLAAPGLTQRELCEKIGVSRSTLSFHVNSLLDQAILERESVRPERRYFLADTDLTRAILTKYKETLGEVGPLRAPPEPAVARAEA